MCRKLILLPLKKVCDKCGQQIIGSLKVPIAHKNTGVSDQLSVFVDHVYMHLSGCLFSLITRLKAMGNFFITSLIQQAVQKAWEGHMITLISFVRTTGTMLYK